MSVSPAAGNSNHAHEPESTITIEAEPDPAPQLILPTLPGVTAADIHEPIDEPTSFTTCSIFSSTCGC